MLLREKATNRTILRYNLNAGTFKQVVLGKLVNHMQKTETRMLFNTIHKNKLKMD